MQRASKYVNLRSENQDREAPDFLALAKSRVGRPDDPVEIFNYAERVRSRSKQRQEQSATTLEKSREESEPKP